MRISSRNTLILALVIGLVLGLGAGLALGERGGKETPPRGDALREEMSRTADQILTDSGIPLAAEAADVHGASLMGLLSQRLVNFNGPASEEGLSVLLMGSSEKEGSRSAAGSRTYTFDVLEREVGFRLCVRIATLPAAAIRRLYQTPALQSGAPAGEALTAEEEALATSVVETTAVATTDEPDCSGFTAAQSGS